MNKELLNSLIAEGIAARLSEIETELRSFRVIMQAPDKFVALSKMPKPKPPKIPASLALKRKRAPMTAAQRKAVSRRMRAYWRAKRGER
jgi:hypothetical protein